MAIKFGDLIQNINADQAVIDLLSNNAKGLLFVTDFSDTTASGGGVQAIPLGKRGGKGAMVLDQATGNLYAFLGTQIPTSTILGEAVTNSHWDDTTSSATNWVQIGQVPIRETDLYANINPGPEPFAAGASVTNAQLRDKINEIINNPPETFGRFKAGDLVVAAGDDRNALDIIIDALSATQAYDLEITSVTSSGGIEFGQTSGTVSLNGKVSSVNFNLLNAAGQNIVPTEYKWYYREAGLGGGTEWSVAQDWTDIADGTFTEANFTFTNLTGTHTFTSADVSSQYDWDGFEYQLELRDNSDGTANISTSVTPGATDFVSGSPIVAVDTGAAISTSAYVPPTAIIQISRTTAMNNADSDSPSGYANTSDFKRLKGALSSRVEYSITPSTSNAGTDGSQAGLLPITDLKLQIVRTVNGNTQAGADISTYTLVEGQNPTTSNQNFTSATAGIIDFTNGQISNSPATLDAFTFVLYYKDASSANWQAAATATGVELRMPVYAGFTTATSSITGALAEEPSLNVNSATLVAANTPADLTATVVKGLTFTFGGWSAGDQTVDAPYRNSTFTGFEFPRYYPIIGKAEDADDASVPTSNGGGTNGGGYQYQDGNGDLGSTYGWIHNLDSAPGTGGYQSPFLGSNGDAGVNNTRFCMAFPNDGWKWGVKGVGQVNPSVSFRFDITVNGVTQEYQVSLSNFQEAEDSSSNKNLIFNLNN
jgi:hypothetical protein